MAKKTGVKSAMRRAASTTKRATRTAAAKTKSAAKKSVRVVRASAKKAGKSLKAATGKKPSRPSAPTSPARKSLAVRSAKAGAMPSVSPMPQAGEPAPLFTLPDGTGTTVRLEDLRGKKVVLYFYPKDDTPGCTIEAHEFSALREEFERRGAVVLGVSRDSARSHRSFSDKCGLTVTLLSDEKGETCARYGVLARQKMYGKDVVGVSRVTFVIGKDGRIERVYRDVSPPGHARAVLEAL